MAIHPPRMFLTAGLWVARAHTSHSEDWDVQVTDLAQSCRAQCDFLKEQLKKSYVGTKVDPATSAQGVEGCTEPAGRTPRA